MLTQEIIRRKRDGHTLQDSEIRTLVARLTDGTMSEGQAAAFAMAVYFKGMTAVECAALTLAMTHSGRVMTWGDKNLPGPVLDKHSTGGIGDNVSLMLAPAVAACGGFVPMISGRGLGHTGGTQDKLDAIPGYISQPDQALFVRAVRAAGCAIIGQTADLAPADRRLYAIRDVTATVESIPLITASILSKKLAAGLDGLVMDVKTGPGAFMIHIADARALANSIVSVANTAGLATQALITDMSQPLASAAGNAVEVQNAVDYLTGKHRDPRLHGVVVALGAQMLMLGGLAPTKINAANAIERAITSGLAAEHFDRMIAALGGPRNFVAGAAGYLPQSPVVVPVRALRTGFVAAIDSRSIGVAVIGLGGGRRVASDAVDPAVGFTGLLAIGAPVAAGQPLGFVHARSTDAAAIAQQALQRAVTIADLAPAITPAIIEVVTYQETKP